MTLLSLRPGADLSFCRLQCMWVVIGPPPLASRDQRRVSVLGKRCLLHGSDTRHGSRAVKAARTAMPTTQHRCACRLVSPNTEALGGRPGEPLASGRPHFGQPSSFIQSPQICAECLLCSRPCCGYQGHRWEQNPGGATGSAGGQHVSVRDLGEVRAEPRQHLRQET